MRLGVVAELVGCVGVVGLEEGVVRVLLRQSRDVTKLEPHKSSDDFSKETRILTPIQNTLIYSYLQDSRLYFPARSSKRS